MITNGAVKALSNQLQSGIIDRREFAIRLKRLYDQAGTTFDEETLDELVDNVTSEDNNCMQTFIPGFHD